MPPATPAPPPAIDADPIPLQAQFQYAKVASGILKTPRKIFHNNLKI